MHAIDIQKLRKTYSSGLEALKGVDLQVDQGDFYALLGANGAGKTTLIGTLVGLVNRTGGKVKIFGKEVLDHPEETKCNVGLVPQEFNFNIFEKVQDIVLTQAGYYGVPRSKALAKTEELLKALDLWEKRNSPSRTLSGGMKRRLMIARALVHQPKLLILDEPTAGVDVELRHSMWDYLRELNKKGTTILLTTHYLEEAEQLCKKVAIIQKGEIVKQGSVRSLLKEMSEAIYQITLSEPAKKITSSRFRFSPTEDPHHWEVAIQKGQSLSELFAELDKNKLTVLDLGTKGNRLEQLFLNLLES
jgi:ABC-2 type transport system ATP-binding protein